MSIELGQGTYSAFRQDGILYIVASGETPNLQTKVTIEQLPFRIFPPQFALLFETPGITSPVVTPFHIERAFADYPPESFVNILDRNGLHTIDIVEKPTARMSLSAQDFISADFVVYRQIGTQRYLIAKSAAIVIDIYEKVFGPDTFANCQAYVAAHALPVMPPLGIVPYSFHAWINTQPVNENGPKFIAIVDAYVGVGWTVNLVSAVPQGINPLIKLLSFEVSFPADQSHSHAMVLQTFRYEEVPAHLMYTHATIINASSPATTRVEIVA